MLAEANDFNDIDFDISWIMDMLSLFTRDLSDLTNFSNLDTIKEWITSIIISFDNLKKFLPDIPEPANSLIELAQDVFK